MRINEIINLVEIDPERRGFLKKMGKGALGVGAAAAMSMLPKDALAALDKDKDEHDEVKYSNFTLKDLKFGMNQDQVKEIVKSGKKLNLNLIGKVRKVIGTDNRNNLGLAWGSLLGQNLKRGDANALFSNNKLYEIRVITKSKKIDAMVNVLTNKFGKPDSFESDQKGFGNPEGGLGQITGILGKKDHMNYWAKWDNIMGDTRISAKPRIKGSNVGGIAFRSNVYSASDDIQS